MFRVLFSWCVVLTTKKRLQAARQKTAENLNGEANGTEWNGCTGKFDQWEQTELNRTAW